MSARKLSCCAAASESLVHTQVWRYLLREAGVALLVRTALDDAHGAVVAAACEALASLVGPTPAEEVIYEAADANPGVGGCCWRLFALRALR
jgi:hypothetical protein